MEDQKDRDRNKISQKVFYELLITNDTGQLKKFNVEKFVNSSGYDHFIFNSIDVEGDIRIKTDRGNRSYNFDNCKFDNLYIQDRVANFSVDGKCNIQTLTITNEVSEMILRTSLELFYIHKLGKVRSLNIKAEIVNCKFIGKTERVNLAEIKEELIIDGDHGPIELDRANKVYVLGIIESFKTIKGLNKLRVSGNIGDITINNNLGNVKIEEDGKVGKINLNGEDGHFINSGQTNDITIQGLLGEGNKGIVRIDGTSRNLYIRGRSNQVIINGKVRNIDLLGRHTNVKLWGEFNIYKSEANIKSLEIFGEGKSLSIEGNKKIENLEIKNVCIEEGIFIRNVEIDSITIEKNIGQSDIFVENGTINKLLIENTLIHEEESFNFTDSFINNFTMKKLRNNGYMNISNVKPSEERKHNINRAFTLNSCVLGQTHFISMDFSKYDWFKFFNSSLLECFIAECNFNISFDIPFDMPNNYPEKSDDQKVLFFSQVKKAYENQGDISRATEMQAKELESYRKKLKVQVKFEKILRKNSNPKVKSINLWNNRKDRIVLWINKYSSNYGTNWLRAAIVTLIGVVVLYSAYLYSLGYRMGVDLDKFSEMASHSLSYLNPLRDEDTGQLFEVVDTDFNNGYLGERNHAITPLARVIDYVSRIIIAFMVYQTIAAFRRLGKSGN